MSGSHQIGRAPYRKALSRPSRMALNPKSLSTIRTRSYSPKCIFDLFRDSRPWPLILEFSKTIGTELSIGFDIDDKVWRWSDWKCSQESSELTNRQSSSQTDKQTDKWKIVQRTITCRNVKWKSSKRKVNYITTLLLIEPKFGVWYVGPIPSEFAS